MTQARPYKALAVFASLIGSFSGSAVGTAYSSTSHATNMTTCASAAELSDGWTIATPESVGFESSHLCAIGKAAANGRLRNLHGVVVVRHGQLVFEQYFTGPDRRWGSSLGYVTFRAETLHDMRSITKSIVSLLYGIAQAQDKVASVERPLLNFFPELADLRTDPARMRILVKHALTMTMGTEWKESLAWEDPVMMNVKWKSWQTDIGTYWTDRWSQPLENAGTTTAVRQRHREAGLARNRSAAS